jgi:hypothetical protein
MMAETGNDGGGKTGMIAVLVALITAGSGVAIAYINRPTVDPRPQPAPVSSGGVPTPVPVPQPKPDEFTPKPEPKPEPAPDPKAEKQTEIGGTWNFAGLAAQVTQDGDSATFAVPTATPASLVYYTGDATVEGHHASWDFTSPIGDTGRCDDLVIARSSDRIQGTCLHQNGVRTPFLMTR